MSELHKAIIKVMKEVGYVQKEGKVSFGNTKYNYAGEVDLIKAIRPVMVKNDLNLVPHKITHMEVVGNKVYIGYIYLMTHAESGESIEIAAVGEGQDHGDKSAYKAATGAFKYAMRQSFIIETGDDPDKTSSDELEKNLLDTKAREDAWKQYCSQKTNLFKEAKSSEELEAVMDEKEWQKVNKKLRKDLPKFYDRFMDVYNECYNNLNAHPDY